jgi:hypothetical protein
MRFHGVFLGHQHAMWPKQHNGKISNMHYIHHVAVNSENIKVFRQVLAKYRDEHPWIITGEGVGFLGHNYLVHATKDIAHVFREAGIVCSVNEF